MLQEDSYKGYNQYSHNSIYKVYIGYSSSERAKKMRLVLIKQTDKHIKDEYMVYKIITRIEAVINE